MTSAHPGPGDRRFPLSCGAWASGGHLRAKLTVRRCDISTARMGIARLHRHLRNPPPSALVAFECLNEHGWPIGWVLVGRPSSRILQGREWVEVTRCAHDGTRNAGSALYGACARWARAQGRPIITYTLPTETGASLRGAGWIEISRSRGGYWSRDKRPRKRGPVEGIPKLRWVSRWSLDAVNCRETTTPTQGPRAALAGEPEVQEALEIVD